MSLDDEGARATKLLAGKVLARVVRHRAAEVMIEFEDGTRLFVESAQALELSVT